MSEADGGASANEQRVRPPCCAYFVTVMFEPLHALNRFRKLAHQYGNTRKQALSMTAHT